MRKLSLGEVEQLAWWSETLSEEQYPGRTFQDEEGDGRWWVARIARQECGDQTQGAASSGCNQVAGDPLADSSL